MIRKILLPTDGSTNSKTALEYGIYMAHLLQASLIGFHVIDVNLFQGPLLTDVSGAAGIPPYEGYFDAIEKTLQEKADRILKDFQNRCRNGGIPCEIRKTTDRVSSSIIDEAQNCDMILMAKKGDPFPLKEGRLLGSVAESVIRNAGKPVMITPEKFIEIKSLALAYDGSPSATKALDLSLELSRRNGWPLSALIITSDANRAASLAAQIKEASDKTAGKTQACDCKIITLTGKESETLLNFIHEATADLIAMGAYGHNRLRELLLGSTTSYIVRKSPIPVLLIR